jgi:hypothetical protein
LNINLWIGNVKKYLFWGLLFSIIPLPVLAQITGHLGTGYFYIKGLEASKPYEVGLGGMPFIRSGLSDSCGVVQIRPRRSLQASEKVEIVDTNSYTFTNTNLQIRDNYKCAKQTEARAVWKNSAGLVFVSGFTPSKALTIRFLGDNPNRTVTSNFCGFIRVVLQNPIPKAIFLNNQALPTTGTPGSNFACNKNNLYVSYPKIVQDVQPVDKNDWITQNPVEPSPNTTSINGGGNGGNTNNEPAIYINQDDELILTGKTPGRTIEVIYNGNGNVQGSGEVTVDSCGRARMFALFIYGVGFIPTSYTITAPTTIVEKYSGNEVARYQIQPSQIQRNINLNPTCS